MLGILGQVTITFLLDYWNSLPSGLLASALAPIFSTADRRTLQWVPISFKDELLTVSYMALHNLTHCYFPTFVFCYPLLPHGRHASTSGPLCLRFNIHMVRSLTSFRFLFKGHLVRHSPLPIFIYCFSCSYILLIYLCIVCFPPLERYLFCSLMYPQHLDLAHSRCSTNRK